MCLDSAAGCKEILIPGSEVVSEVSSVIQRGKER